MTGSRRLPFLSLAAVVIGCPGPRELDGLACDESGACSEGYTCHEGRCLTIPECGNGIRDALEPCEEDDVNGATCPAGTLGAVVCSTSCTLDYAGCVLRCGDGVRAGAEACDDGNATDADLCSADCTAQSVPALETEPNDDGTPEADVDDFLASAANGPLTADALVAGDIGTGDQDAWSLTTAADVTVEISIHGRAGIGTCDTGVDVRVREASGAVLFAVGDGSITGCPRQRLGLQAGRTVYVEAYAGSGGGSYLLAVDFTP